MNFHLASSPRDFRAQTPAVSVPSTSCASEATSCDPSEAPEERDLDLEDYKYEQEPAAGGGRQAENPLAALLTGSLTSTPKIWRLCCTTCNTR